ncbi:hypothetical protein Cgig2_024129 [Carnegiea gigantea]|uniref:EF-hand domain-containing protein n=1 Tax=Carnegiea gigantea TaxID=171969 RepID=A0A9Q1JVK8_9CARY|nr:hypothetical protein Cgig2_024129 [Carnegiea gigantea]
MVRLSRLGPSGSAVGLVSRLARTSNAMGPARFYKCGAGPGDAAGPVGSLPLLVESFGSPSGVKPRESPSYRPSLSGLILPKNSTWVDNRLIRSTQPSHAHTYHSAGMAVYLHSAGLFWCGPSPSPGTPEQLSAFYDSIFDQFEYDHSGTIDRNKFQSEIKKILLAVANSLGECLI